MKIDDIAWEALPDKRGFAEMLNVMRAQERRIETLEQLVEVLQAVSARQTSKARCTAEQADEYIAEKWPLLEPFGADFVDYQESTGWVVGKKPIKSWRHALATWAKRREHDPKAQRKQQEWPSNAWDAWREG
jgi:hypothetical protein